MKKMKQLSLGLALILLMQCLFLPVVATEAAPVETTSSEAAPVFTEPEELEFGEACIQQGCRTINGMVPLAGSDRRLDTAQGVFLYEIQTETVVYAYNPDMKLHPGTLAKMVLALIVLENCDREDMVVVTEGIQSYIPSGAATVEGIPLKSLEELTVNDLLHAVLMDNANDAAVALAHHVAGTSDAFLQLMNARVRQMGCTNTEFGNISGLYTAQSYSTARDMAKIVCAAIENEDFAEIFGAVEYEIPPTNLVEKSRSFYTSNYMMDQRIIPNFYDKRVKGGIQSYHAETGASIACVAENAAATAAAEAAAEGGSSDVTQGLRYIAVVLGATRTFAENGWQPVIHGNFNELSDLLEYGFDNFKVNRILYDGMSLSQFSVLGGESNAVGQAQVNIDSVVPKTAQMNNLVMNYKIAGKGDLSAPVEKGQMIATMNLSYRNSILAEAEVYAMGRVMPANKTGVTIHSTAAKSDADSSGFWSVVGKLCVIVLALAAGYLAFNAYMRSRIRAQRRRRRQNRRRAR